MRIKKVVKRLIALGAGATMLGATVMGAMAADLNSYPKSFNTDGVFNGYFVVGEAAKPIDNLAMTDIATSMWYNKPAAKATTTVEGDAWMVGTSSKKFEMADSNTTVSSITGEQVRDMMTYIGKEELDALKEGKYKTGESEYTYNQYMYFDQSNSNTHEIVKYAEDNDDETDVFFFVDSGKPITLYKLEFSASAESDVYNTAGSACTTGTVLQDFEDTKINILGKDYDIVLARRPKAAPEDSIQLTLMGGAISGSLLEGETQTYTLSGEEYSVTLAYVDATYAKFTVNGESTDKIQVGETYKLASGKEVGVSEILYQSYAGGIHSSDFFLGASKIVLKDETITNEISDTELTVGGTTISGADVIVTGTDDNTTFRLTTIQVNMTAQDDYFVPKDGKLSDEIVAEGDKKQLLFTNNWDFEFKGLTDEESHDLKIDSNTDRKYKLVWYDGDGNKVDMPLFYANSSTLIQFSEDEAEKCVVLAENLSIAKNDYFVVTGGTAADGTGKSYALQYKGADKVSTTSPKIQFKNLGNSETLEYSIDTTGGNTVCDIKLGGYTFSVNNITSKVSKDFEIIVDADADGVLGHGMWASGNSAGYSLPIDILDSYGAQIRIAPGASVNNFTHELDPSGPVKMRACHSNMTNAWVNITTENTNDYDDQKPSRIGFLADATTTNEVTAAGLYIAGTSNPSLTPEGEENIGYGYTTMGGKLTYSTPSSSPNLLTYNYPKTQRLPQVYVTSGAVTSSTTAEGELALVQVVDASKLDTEIADKAAQNLIVVGGPCVNSIAAELLGSPADCTEGFSPGKARIKMLDTGAGKLAMLVAGYSGEDTRLAGKVIAHRYKELSGEEVEVAGTTYSDATIGAPTVVEAATTTETTTE